MGNRQQCQERVQVQEQREQLATAVGFTTEPLERQDVTVTAGIAAASGSVNTSKDSED
jgi:hypothetical protein